MPGRRWRKLALLLALAGCPRAFAITLPAGFSDTLVTSVSGPTALAFTPDGRLLITAQGGTLRVYQSGALLPAAALTLGSLVCANGERGLLGVAVDPLFSANHFIYLYYTFRKFGTCPINDPGNPSNPVNRVSRFVLPDTNVIDPATETVLIDNMISPNGNHNGGDLKFGADGLLYVTVGDGGCDYAGDSGCQFNNDAARDLHVLLGKILRIAPDGSIPATNPFQQAGTARCNAGPAAPGVICQETFAWGLRNPFRIAFRPGTNQFRINDVGDGAWEEIDDGQSGADYGWNCREGAHTNSTTGKCNPTPAGMVDPVFNYEHGVTVPGTASSNCNAITGGAFVPFGAWPPVYDNTYLFSDFICGSIFRLNAAAPPAASDFGTGLGGGSAVDLRFGPFNGSESLYYTTYALGGQVRRIDAPPNPATSFFTVPPCRLVDTRGATGPFGAPALAASSATRSFTIGGAAACGVPADAVAVSVNVTVVAPGSAGSLTFLPSGVTGATASTINFPAGRTRANNAILNLRGVPAGLTTVTSGFPAGTCHLIIDVNGYFR